MNAENFAANAIAEFPSFVEMRLRGITHRRAFADGIGEKIRNFRAGKGMRIIILYGLRGTGKTTALLQIAAQDRDGLFFVRGDELGANKVDLFEFVDALDKISRETIGLKAKNILIIDEVTYIPEWALKIKVLHDKRPNLLIIATSSSSMALSISPDLARRGAEVMATPLTFREYLLLKQAIDIPDRLAAKIFKKIISGEIPREESIEVRTIAGEKSLAGIYEDYVKSDMPLSLSVEGEEYFEGLKSVVKKMVYEDLSKYGNMDASILPKAEQMIFFLSTVPSDGVRIESLSAHLSLSKDTVVKLLKMFEQSLLIRGLDAHGRRKAIKMPKKWLFLSPSIRYSLAKGLGMKGDETGNLREDAVHMHLSVKFSDIYYSHEADFMMPDGKLAIEVGGKKSGREVKGFNTFTLVSEDTIDAKRMPIYLFLLAF
jgi:predicted AAA+ superfamily ATPase